MRNTVPAMKSATCMHGLCSESFLSIFPRVHPWADRDFEAEEIGNRLRSYEEKYQDDCEM